MQESIKMNERSQNLYNLSQQDNVVYHNKNIYIYEKMDFQTHQYFYEIKHKGMRNINRFMQIL